MPYLPYRIAEATLEAVSSSQYRSFLEKNVLAAGIELLLARRSRRPDYPYPDTKFNPNNGEDYTEGQYETLFTWFIGRGSEACTRHLDILETIDDLAASQEAAREMLAGYVRSQNEAILGILDANNGRVPFRVDRSLRGIDETGHRVSLPADGCNASELFCAKALIAAGRPNEVEVGQKLFQRFVDVAFANGYEDDTASYPRNLHAESPFMLSLAAFDYLSREQERVVVWMELAARMLDYLLDNFWEPDTGNFYEMIDFASGEKQPMFLPGHACELVGLGLQAISALDQAGAAMARANAKGERITAAFDRGRRELPRILLASYALGYDHTHGGMYQAVEPRSGNVLNSDLPWWCLPEAMRAAAHVATAAEEPQLRHRALEILQTASNDYFLHYPNPAMRLFPFRTRSGETGRVKNLMPVVPEADPLYHTNLAIIDMLAVFDRLDS